MYNNIGNKIKTLAKVIAILGIIISVIYGIILIVQGINVGGYGSYFSRSGSTLVWAGIFVMILGSLGSWISSWALYAIGDTNVKTTEMYNKSLMNTSQTNTNNSILSNTYLKPNYSSTATHKFRCDQCGNMITEFPCNNCGYNPEPNIKKCQKCGAEISSTSAFCKECGTKQDDD